MKTITYSLKFNFFFLLFLISSVVLSQSIATYDITFTSVWNAADHGTLPPNPHWSDLDGATHNSSVTFLEMGEMASPGIKFVAEEGGNSTFMGEVTTAITGGTADQWLQESFSGGALGSATLSNIEVSEDFPLLSLASMIAPSPDWFIGINGFSLLDGGNNWKTGIIIIDMFPYDAGTDSGTGYTSADLVTMPQGDITSLVNVSPFGSNKIGTLTITLKSVLSADDFDTLNSVRIFPIPTKGKLTISNIQNKNVSTVEVYSTLGQLVNHLNLKEGLSFVDLNLETLHNGMYLLKINTVEGQSKTQKLVVQ